MKKRPLCVILMSVALVLAAVPAWTAEYVGSEACGECHVEEYDNFMEYAKKRKSYESVAVMAPDLNQEELAECYSCHTTGYGEPSGFVSLEATPHLANAGCEVCHGPGSVHVYTMDMDDIKHSLSLEDCEFCHNQERISAFNYKPLLHGGAH